MARPKIFTAFGNAQITTAKTKFGTGSGIFDGTGDYIQTPDDSDFDFSSSNGTIDFWIWMDTLPVTYYDLMGQAENFPSTDDWFIYINTAGFIAVGIPTVSELRTPNSSLGTGAWHHVAVVKNGTRVDIYIDGTSQANGTGTYFNNSAQAFRLGDQTINPDFNGYIDELRFSNIARWTANFTPASAAYTNDANTTCLLHMDGTNGSTTFTDDNSSPSTASTVNNNFLLMGV